MPSGSFNYWAPRSVFSQEGRSAVTHTRHTHIQSYLVFFTQSNHQISHGMVGSFGDDGLHGIPQHQLGGWAALQATAGPQAADFIEGRHGGPPPPKTPLPSLGTNALLPCLTSNFLATQLPLY